MLRLKYLAWWPSFLNIPRVFIQKDVRLWHVVFLKREKLEMALKLTHVQNTLSTV